MTKTLRTFVYGSGLIIGLAACLLAWVVWSYVYPFDPLTVNPGSWQTTKTVVRRGDWLNVRLDYCQHNALVPRLDFTIEQDDRLMLMAPAYGTNQTGCKKEESPILQIPYNLALESTTGAGSGTARILVTVTFRINSLREVQYHYKTNTFVIEP